MAVEGARQGRRTCVVTIDPARRLADAFGLDSLTNEPGWVDGAWGGELWALMLDTKSTFDAAVVRYARDPAQARAIQESRLFRNLRDALSGTQEYMAVEKLYQLHQEGGFDLIVVDTPPTRRAVDFLNAPRHLTRVLDNPAIRVLVMPSRAYLRAVSVVAQAPLTAVAKIVGSELVLDTVAFVRAFEGMEVGIRTRAKRVVELFAEPSTAFALVIAPRRHAIDEGQFFAARLGQHGIPVQALVVNRLHPHFDALSASLPPTAPGGEPRRTRCSGSAQAFNVLNGNWEELRAVVEGEENCLTALAAQLAPALVARVPLLDGDVHNLDGVQAVADHLSGRSGAGNLPANSDAQGIGA
ncbi:MAG TPA: ArsA-related P-loop ATPase [Acidimicrobiales bacterium]|nr:ArsA-related P-loop ATPase [Acidimicrobiales bacterium]